MEQQMTDLGQELVRTQTMLAEMNRQPPAHHANSQPRHGNLITEDDVANYGTELIDLARRAAMDTVQPEIEALRAQNAELTNRVKNTAKREMFMAMDRAVPTWRQINTDQRFINWLRLRNVYTGQIRQDMLKAAVDGADAPKAIQFFKDFLTEAQATGHTAPAQQQEQHDPAPRSAAVSLETLAAPGKARPASGDTQMPADKPIYTRADISRFYDEKRRQLWANRPAEAAAFEADLTAAQREGRIRG
jgi:hypothetical protein